MCDDSRKYDTWNSTYKCQAQTKFMNSCEWEREGEREQSVCACLLNSITMPMALFALSTHNNPEFFEWIWALYGKHTQKFNLHTNAIASTQTDLLQPHYSTVENNVTMAWFPCENVINAYHIHINICTCACSTHTHTHTFSLNRWMNSVNSGQNFTFIKLWAAVEKAHATVYLCCGTLCIEQHN